MMKISPIVKQIWIVMGVLFNDLSQGMVISFPSIMVPALIDPDADMKLDIDTATWIASFIGVGAMMGFLSSSVLMELYGRKFAYIFFLITGVIGWLFLYFGNYVPVLIVGRLLGGISSSSSASIGSVVIGEYTNPRERGMFLNLRIAILCVGNLVVHLSGHFLNWRTVTLISLSSATTAAFIVCTWPESPSWFASVKKFEDCERSFYWLRGKSADSIQELKELLRAQRERLSKTSVSNTLYSKLIEFFKKLKRKDFIKPVIIIVLSGGLLEASGAHIFPAYALQIIEQVTGNKAETFYYTLGLDIIITFSVIISSVLVKYFKRRTLMFISGFISMIILYFISLYLFLASKNIIPREKTYIPIVLFGIYLIVNNLGCLTVASLLLGEIFPLVHRGSGTCVSCVVLSFVLMFSMKITPYLLASIKVYGTFTVLGTLMFILLISLWFMLPETKDRTLQEIEDFFNYGQYIKVETKNIEDVNDVLI